MPSASQQRGGHLGKDAGAGEGGEGVGCRGASSRHKDQAERAGGVAGSEMCSV